MPSLDDLLVRSRELNSELSTNHKRTIDSIDVTAQVVPVLQALPRIDRDLSQVMEAGKRLWKSLGSPTNFTNEQKAKAALVMNKQDTNFILPSNTPSLKNLLKSTDLAPLDPCKDLEQLLSNERENAILGLIENSEKDADNLVFNTVSQATIDQWNKDKCNIKANFSNTGGLINETLSNIEMMNSRANLNNSYSFFNTSNLNSSGLNSSKFINTSIYNNSGQKFSSYSSMDALEKTFADIIKNSSSGDLLNSFYNERDRISQIGRRMNNTLSMEDNFRVENIMDLWDVINHQLSNTKNVNDTNLKVKALHGASIDYLENRFRAFVETSIKNSNFALSLSNKSLPSTVDLVNAYTIMTEKRSKFGINNTDLEYAKVYFALRMGDVDTAIQFSPEPLSSAIANWKGIGSHQANLINEPTINNFINKSNQKLSPNFEQDLSLKYKRIYNTHPYFGAILAILGCGNINDDYSEVTSSAECWIWLAMHQISSFNDDIDKSILNQNYSYSGASSISRQNFDKFQKSIVNSSDGSLILESFSDQPITYVKLLLLSQQYDLALDILTKIGDNIAKVHVPHLGIILNEDKLLDRSGFNFGKSIINYCSRWSSKCPEYAVYYYYYLNGLPDTNSNGIFDKQSTLFHESISKLIFEGISDNIFGQLFNQNNGQIYKLLNRKESKLLFNKVAKDCEKHGRIEQAIKLFEIANEYNNCCDLLIDGMANGKTTLFKLATEFTDRVGIKTLEKNVDNIETLLLVMDITQLMVKLNSAEKMPLKQSMMIDIASFEIVCRINIIPQSVQAVDDCCEQFRTQPSSIRTAFPNLLISIMKLYVRLSSTMPEEKIRLKEAANSLVMFSGRVKYRTSASINAQLVYLQLSV